MAAANSTPTVNKTTCGTSFSPGASFMPSILCGVLQDLLQIRKRLRARCRRLNVADRVGTERHSEQADHDCEQDACDRGTRHRSTAAQASGPEHGDETGDEHRCNSQTDGLKVAEHPGGQESHADEQPNPFG